MKTVGTILLLMIAIGTIVMVVTYTPSGFSSVFLIFLIVIGLMANLLKLWAGNDDNNNEQK